MAETTLVQSRRLEHVVDSAREDHVGLELVQQLRTSMADYCEGNAGPERLNQL